MSLADCITKAGKALSPEDRAFLEDLMDQGIPDHQALNQLEVAVKAELRGIVREVQRQGKEVFYSQSGYHGTQAKIQTRKGGRYAFSTAFMGTGDGTQKYGWGLYFASVRAVAEWYRDSFGRMKNRPRNVAIASKILPRHGIDPSEQAITNFVRAAEQPGNPVDIARKIKRGRDIELRAEDVTRLARAINDFRAKMELGYIYTVDLVPAEDEYLHWDLPINEQPEKIQNIIRQFIPHMYDESIERAMTFTGADIYKDLAEMLGSQESASLGLLRKGIRGNKFWDGETRDKDGNKTHNYVIFDEDDVRITGGYEEEIELRLSAATGTIPGLKALQNAANRNDKQSSSLLQHVALDSLNTLIGHIPGVEMAATRAVGLYGGDLEPSIGVSLKFDIGQRERVMAGVARFAINFNQEQVHELSDPMEDSDIGHVYDDGSFNTVVFQFDMDKTLNRRQIEDVANTAGFYGFTVTSGRLEAYYVGDPNNEQEIEQFYKAAEKATQLVGSTPREISRRLSIYGEGGIDYGSITGDVYPPAKRVNRTAHRIAQQVSGLMFKPFTQASDITPEQRAFQERVRDEYEKMPLNDLANPRVRRAYSEMADEVIEQYAALPIKTEFYTWEESGNKEPYPNSGAMRADVLVNNRLKVLRTDSEAFGPKGVVYDNHPLLAETSYVDQNGKVLLVNDLFRAIHDYYAHTMSEAEFGPKGEEAAWQNHARMFKSPWARWAMTSETRGQNSWVNFRAEVQDLPLVERGFGEQKVGLLPIDIALTGDAEIDAPVIQLMEELGDVSLSQSLWFYSSVDRLLDSPKFQGFNPSKKNPEGRMPGKQIWKIIQSMNPKKIELEYMGLEEFLNTDQKFTRDEVREFIETNGIVVDEVIAKEPQGEDDQIDWGWSEPDDDPENYNHYVEDYMDAYDYDNAEVAGLDMNEWLREWAENNPTFAVQQVYNDLDESLQNHIDASDDTFDTILEELIDEHDLDLDQFRKIARDDFEEVATATARDIYMDDPVIITTGDINGHEYRITGNESQGYEIAFPDGSYSSNAIYSLNEAQIQAHNDAIENGYIRDEDDTTTTRWEIYVQNSPSYSNYREVKLLLPEVPGSFVNDVHFPDENIVAFLRVTDREMYAAAAPPVSQDVQAEIEAMLPPPGAIDFNQPLPDEIWARFGEDGNYSDAQIEQAKELWESREPDTRQLMYDRSRQKFIASQLAKLDTRLTPEEAQDSEHPQNEVMRERLENDLTDEKFAELVKKERDKLAALIYDRLETGMISPEKAERWIAEIDDWTMWANLYSDVTGGHDYRNPATAFQNEKDRHLRHIETNNRNWNSIEEKLKRAGKGPVNTLYLDEVQSDWASDIRRYGYDNKLPLAERQAIMREESKIRQEVQTELEFALAPGSTDVTQRADHMTVQLGWEVLRNWRLNPYDPHYNRKKEIQTELAAWGHEELVAKVKQVDELMGRIGASNTNVPYMPFLGDNWLSLAMKRAIMLGVTEGYDAVAWPNNQTIQERWSENYDYSAQYDNKMPSLMKKLTKKQPVLVDEKGVAIELPRLPKVDTSGWKVEQVIPGDEDWLGGEDWVVTIPELGIEEKAFTLAHQAESNMYGHQIRPAKYPGSRDEAIEALLDQEGLRKVAHIMPFYEVREDVVDGDTWYLAFDKKTGERVGNRDGSPIFSTTPLDMWNKLVSAHYEKHFPKPKAGYWTVPIDMELRERVEESSFPVMQEDRGRFYPGMQDNIIQLTKTSDLSTFLHESGHLFLEIQKVWARKYGLDDNQKAMLKWLGVSSFEEVTPEHQERWAESFEVYLREGKAPSLELRAAFAAFSRWLKKIYRSILDQRLRRADPGDEIAQIFNRMLATEEQIAEVTNNPEYDQYFRSKEQAGMSDKQWREYQKRAERMKNRAEQTLDEKILSQYMRAQREDWKAERRPLIEEERNRLRQLPVYQVLTDLASSKSAWFDTASLRTYFPDGKIPRKLSFKHRKEGGIDPRDYAEAYEFSSVPEMLDAVMSAEPLNEAATNAAEARMVDKYGDIFNDGTLEAEAREALINEDQAVLLSMEIGAKQKGINREYLKAQATNMISKMKFSEIRPGRYYHAMVRAAQDAARGTSDVTEAKIRQLTNHYLYREAIRVRQQMESHRRRIRNVGKRKFDTKKIDSEYAQKIKMLVEMYDMRQSPEQIAKLSDILNFYIGQESDDVDLTLLDPNLIAAMEYRANNQGSLANFQLIQFEDMTAEDLHGVVDMIDHLNLIGRLLAEENGEEAMRQRLAFNESVRKHGGKDHPVQRHRQRPFKRSLTVWNSIVNSLPSIINLVRKLDGMESGGEAFNQILRPLHDAQAEKMRLHERYYRRFEELVGDISRVRLTRFDTKRYQLSSGEFIELSSEEVFMMALYWGTESSREAIRQGHGVTDADVMTIMSGLTKDQLRLVNAVWMNNETHWQELQRAAVEMEGYAPPKLEATPFIVNGVQMTGGHMQLFYDSQRIDLATERDIGSRRGSVMPTKAGTLNARVGSGGQPVKLDIHNITRSLDDKIHFIAFARVGRQLRRLLNHKETVAAIERKHGPKFYETLIKDIEAITTNRMAQETSEGAVAISRWVRSSATMMNLMYSIRNTVQQITSVFIAQTDVNPIQFSWASIQMLQNRRAMVREINAKSAFMKDRATIINRDTREAMRKMIRTSRIGEIYDIVKSHGFMLQTAVDSLLAYPIWLAKYQRVMDETGDETRAVIEADTAVGESVGSGSDMHLGRIMQSNQNEFAKTLTVFGSWFNAYYQRLYRSSKGGTDFINLRLAMDAVILPIIAANVAQALILDEPDTGGDEDETFLEWAMKNYLLFMAGTIPVLREIGNSFRGWESSAPINQMPGAVARFIRESEAYLEDRQTAGQTAIDIGRVFASVTKIPGSGQLLRSLEYYNSYLQGEEGDVFAPYQMLVEGKDRDAR